MIKKISAAMLAAALTCSLCAPANALDTSSGSLEHFQKTSSFVPGQFTDIPAGKWYVNSVATAFEYDLMGGTGTGSFNPDASIFPFFNSTYAKALTDAGFQPLDDLTYQNERYLVTIGSQVDLNAHLYCATVTVQPR